MEVQYIETSAKTGDNVDKVYFYIKRLFILCLKKLSKWYNQMFWILIMR